jgi:hypothetical protein
MDIEVISTGPIEELIDNKLNSLYKHNCKLMYNNNSLFGRRDILKLAGIGILALATPSIFLKKEAEAIVPINPALLITAGLGLVELMRYLWRPKESTAGEVTLINESNEHKQGPFALSVEGNGKIEDYATAEYTVPPRKYRIYHFTNGPYGTLPGYKQFNAITKIDKAFTNFEVMW